MTAALFSRWACAFAAVLGTSLAWGQGSAPTLERQHELTRMVRQDCGSCHGMRLTGGLGPALTAQALAHKPPPYLQAVILQGIPGTPMPGWSAMLSAPEAQWIAEQLFQGFPEEHRSAE